MGPWPPGFSHKIPLTCFFNKHSLPINVVLCSIGWRWEAGVFKAKCMETWVQSFFAWKWFEIFWKGGRFPVNGCFSKTVFTFYAGLLMQRSLEMRPGYMPSASPNLPLIKLRESYWCYFSTLVFLLPPLPLEIFAVALVRNNVHRCQYILSILGVMIC